MRADAAAIGGIADHHIVDPPVGDEAEWREQRGDLGDMMVNRLHQQSRWLLAQRGETRFGQRAMLHRPTALCADDEARFDLGFTREACPFVRVQRI